MTQAAGQPGITSQFPSVGRWAVTGLPGGWIFVADFGIRQMSRDPRAITANVALGHDMLERPDGLMEYIGAQGRLIEMHLPGVKTAGPQAMQFAGADEAQLFFVRHKPDNAPDMLHAQTYVRAGLWVGIITLTTPEAELRAVRADYEMFVKGLRILSR